MSTIHLLDNHTINKIAAGEVIERPASVVKELVENSIDASASAITVEIKDGGISMIRITDNGVGIASESVQMAFLRHATSKIETENDLEKVLSLGFRGEALASIAAVSQLELITKTSDEITGKRIELHGGEVLTNEEVGCPEGTTIIMKHLFYNTPPRKKFLQSPASEAAKISDIVYKLALGHPQIAFKYINNNKLVFHTSGNHNLKNCVMNVYGKEIARESIDINYKGNNLTIVGLLGKPSTARSNRLYENFFINGRYIKSDTLQNAVEDAYKTLLTVGKFPVVVLHLLLPPDSIDVNVHPTKMEVRFRDSEKIYHLVYEAIRDALSNTNLIPKVAFHMPQRKESEVKHIQQSIPEPFEIKRKENNKPTPQSMVPNVESSTTYNPPRPKQNLFAMESENPVTPSLDKSELSKEIKTSQDGVKIQKKVYRHYSIIGQVFKTYWIVEIENNMYIIDQHAAHERILYEKLLNEFYHHSPDKQILLHPIVINTSPKEKIVIQRYQELLQRFGFDIEEFGGDAFATRTIPILFSSPAHHEFLQEMLDLLVEKEVPNVYETQINTIAVMACKAAVKAHDQLSPLECKQIIEDLMELENPYTCPHGRPTIIAMSKNEVEKRFKRI